MFDIVFPMNVINVCPALWEPMMNSWCADQNKLLILKDWGPGPGTWQVYPWRHSMLVTSEWSACITQQHPDPLYMVFNIQKMELFCFDSFSINTNIKQLLNTHFPRKYQCFPQPFCL